MLKTSRDETLDMTSPPVDPLLRGDKLLMVVSAHFLTLQLLIRQALILPLGRMLVPSHTFVSCQHLVPFLLLAGQQPLLLLLEPLLQSLVLCPQALPKLQQHALPLSVHQDHKILDSSLVLRYLLLPGHDLLLGGLGLDLLAHLSSGLLFVLLLWRSRSGCVVARLSLGCGGLGSGQGREGGALALLRSVPSSVALLFIS
jgi:hypothetical protein